MSSRALKKLTATALSEVEDEGGISEGESSVHAVDKTSVFSVVCYERHARACHTSSYVRTLSILQYVLKQRFLNVFGEFLF